MGHFFLAVVCFITANHPEAVVNTLMFICGIIFIFYVQKKADIQRYIKLNKTIFDRQYTEEDKIAWRKMYLHPVEAKLEKLKNN